MKNKNEMFPLLLLGIAALASGSKTSGAGLSGSIPILKYFIPAVESFSAYPVWDYDQWSWGYGTAAGYDYKKKPAGSITQAKAMQDTIKVFTDHYNYLKNRIKKNLNPNQLAALLSFSYNLGAGVAKNIVDTINTGTTAAVVARMKKYVYAGGKYSQGLMNRRIKETNLYQGFDINKGLQYGRQDLGPMERIHPAMITDYAYE